MNHFDINPKIKSLKIEWFLSLRKGLFYSLFFHLLLVILIQILVIINFDSSTRIHIKKIKQFYVELKEIEEPKPVVVSERFVKSDSLIKKEEKIKFAGIEIDTTEIINRYKENTLNVSILFPAGWIFYDNKVKDIIDGIIFMPGESSNYDRRLSVLIQVNLNKNLFNPRLYDSSFVYNGMEFYISRPIKTFNQLTQTIYIRTGSFKADFIIKCTSPDEIEFKKFQPVFFAMVRSFSAAY